MWLVSVLSSPKEGNGAILVTQVCTVMKHVVVKERQMTIRLTKHLRKQTRTLNTYFFFETYAHVDETVSGKPTSRKPTTL